MTRLVVLAFLCLGASVSRAEGMLPGGATIKFNRLFLHEANTADIAEPAKDPESLWRTFNMAHCVCSQSNLGEPDPLKEPFYDHVFAYELLLENATQQINRPLEIWVGTGCNTTDVSVRDQMCFKVATHGDISSINTTNGIAPEVPIYYFMNPEASRQGCAEREQDGTEWVIADGDGDGTPEYFESKSIPTDSKPPALPTEFSAVGAEGAIVISWTAPVEGVADVAYWQALCATDPGNSPVPNPKPARYLTARHLCDAPQDAFLKPTDVNTSPRTADHTDGGVHAPDAEVDAEVSIQLPQELVQLDPGFICGESGDSTATSMRIEGLTNGQPYKIVFLAVDKFGNAAGTYFTSSLTPEPVTDFWEDLHSRGSEVEGGFCLIAETYGTANPLTQLLRSFRDNTLARSAFGRWLIDVYYGTIGKLSVYGFLPLRILVGVLLLPLVALALLWHLLTLPGLVLLVALAIVARYRRRISRVRLATAMTLGLLVLAPLRASAQSPYWDESIPGSEGELAYNDPARVKWIAGLRLGPYVPAIDAQLDMPAGNFDGPYEEMFGGYAVLPMLDVDYVFWHGIGQLGAGVSIGYMSKSAKAWEQGSSPGDPMRPRSTGDENTFKLIPFSLNAVYRFSYLDDEYGIPLVPYLRGGLAYYVWWSNAPNGDTSRVDKNRARGGTLGVVGSIGLAIRAERIDMSAARSMRDSGIEHAGFYAEYNIGKVDGFGSEKKLAVGDATWFAGINFEF